MPDELVALYDPQVPADAEPRVVGSATRSRVRAENLPHAATAVLLRDGDGLGAGVYVHRRTDTKDVWPGRWDCFAGGVVGAGELPDDAAARELAEELGVHDVPLRRLDRFWFQDASSHHLVHVYDAVRPAGAVVRHQPEEVAEGGWRTLDELRALLASDAPFVPDGRVAAERLLTHPELT
ncbi:NUDIX hydrolase [Angustibacter aerolatus]